MTRTIKRVIAFRVEGARAMRADGGQRGQLIALANEEKPLVAVAIVQTVGGVVAYRPRIHNAFSTGDGGIAAVTQRLAARGHRDRRQDQELPAIHARSCIVRAWAHALSIQRRDWL